MSSNLDLAKNIFQTEIPFGLLTEQIDRSRANTVIFWGADFKYLPPGIPEDKFIELSNLCLDYVRKNCSGSELVYKLHPAETDEYKKLNLEGFKVVGPANIGEFYLLKNLDKIKFTFSAISGACVSAHKMGIPSFVFLELFEPLFLPETKKGYREYFSPLPKDSFISDFSREFRLYRTEKNIDNVLKNNLSLLLKKGARRAFFIVENPGSLVEIIAVSKLMKIISPELRIGLIVCRHHRWDVVNTEDLKPYFDSIHFFKRTFYSLRPTKIIQAIKVSREIKKFPIDNEDILIGMSIITFVESCFISYHRQAKRLAFISKVSFDTVYGNKSKDMLKSIKYITPPASRFYNLFFEPLLGIYRTIYMNDPGKVMNFRKYQKPINEIYDQVYLF